MDSLIKKNKYYENQANKPDNVCSGHFTYRCPYGLFVQLEFNVFEWTFNYGVGRRGISHSFKSLESHAFKDVQYRPSRNDSGYRCRDYRRIYRIGRCDVPVPLWGIFRSSVL